jgi:glutathione synthase
MTRRYLYVMDPIETINPQKDSTFYLMLESQARGVDNLICHIEDLIISDGKGFAYSTPVNVFVPVSEGALYYERGDLQTVAFDDFDVIFMRKDPPVEDKFLAATMLLDCHDPRYTVMFNDSRGLRVANEKLWGLATCPQLMPKTVVSANAKTLHEAAQHFGRAVIKPLFQAGGAGVMVFEKNDRNLRSAIDLLTHESQRPAMVQEYLPAARAGDKRLILLGGKPIGALLRVPQDDDHRANMHIGGSAQVSKITKQDEEIAHILAPHLLALGMHFVGLDIIDGKVTEINVTSPTGLQEIDALEGRAGRERLNVQVMDYVDKLLLQR